MKIYTCDEYIEGLKKHGIIVFPLLEHRIREMNPNGVPSGCFAETGDLIPEHDLRYAAGYKSGEPLQGVTGLSVNRAATPGAPTPGAVGESTLGQMASELLNLVLLRAIARDDESRREWLEQLAKWLATAK